MQLTNAYMYGHFLAMMGPVISDYNKRLISLPETLVAELFYFIVIIILFIFLL